ncbi:hypothetical protein I7I50_09971 [Histoplasma capsulatum G186AR]|uniref:Secreted protein n=1 Tax=Ajellomyces capsulatus TaxID=5037 RepID=A0A8H7Z345_AJECA|nr:hypothetical protein I7I52_01209 [Histoplasma capsulatum]QSS68862.1 hypothetical protein I7I50_09971 [Histoplasma capsulatum G186AR]
MELLNLALCVLFLLHFCERKSYYYCSIVIQHTRERKETEHIPNSVFKTYLWRQSRITNIGQSWNENQKIFMHFTEENMREPGIFTSIRQYHGRRHIPNQRSRAPTRAAF